MRKLIAILIFVSITLPLPAQLTPALVRRPASTTPASDVSQIAEKPADNRTFLQRLFGVRPKPTPAPTPAPVVKRRPKAKARREPGETPESPAPKVARIEKGGTKKGTSRSTGATVEDDVAKFKAAKARALDDAQLKDLKSKADGELNESEAHKALMNYNRALFQKIREIDPSISGYAGKVEQSMTRRIGAEKGKE